MTKLTLIIYKLSIRMSAVYYKGDFTDTATVSVLTLLVN